MAPDVPAPSFRVDAGAHSVVGKVRDHNEDASLVEDDLGLYAVADGMGGHQAGEHASHLAVEVLSFVVGEAFRSGTAPSLDLLLDAFARANDAILEDAAKRPERQGMGTTLTALLVDGGRLLIGHVGDCRAWRVRDGGVEQLTHDHTVVGQRVRAGLLTEEEAEQHPMRHVLSRCLGVSEDLEVDLVEADLAADDVYMIASDGMIPSTSHENLAAAAMENPEVEIAAQVLVNRACDRDGADNITAVVFACREL